MGSDNPSGADNQQERPASSRSALLHQRADCAVGCVGILRGHTQGSTVKPVDEDMVHALWRHREHGNYNGQPRPWVNLAICWKLRVSGGTSSFDASRLVALK